MFIRLVTVLLAFCFFGQTVWAAPAESALITFETEVAGSLPVNWVWITQRDGAQAAVDGHIAYQGKQSLRVSGTQATTVSRVGANPIRDFVPVEGKRYHVKAWVRSENLAADTWIKIEFINKERTQVLGNFFLRPEAGSIDWYLLEGITSAVPQGTAEFWLNINLGGSGTLWVDEVSVEPWEGSLAEYLAYTKAISTALPKVPAPPPDHITAHPSILVRHDEVETLRELRKTSLYKALASMLLPKADAVFFEPLPDEPAPYPDGWEVNHWREMRAVATQVSNNLIKLGFAYLITGQTRYAEEAKRWINLVCGWDVNGTTSTSYHDDLGRWLLDAMSMAVDWIYDTFTPSELAAIRPVLLARGRELFRVQVQGLANNPYDSHAISSLAYITKAALVLSDLPEARQWLEFTTQFYQEVYPPWGGKDGGWNEGIMYWRASMSQALEAAEMLRVAGLADLYQKDWYKNTGYFQMYFQPLDTKDLNAFGDDAFGGGIGDSGYLHSLRLAGALNDPYLKWYTQRIGGSLSSIYAYLFFFRYGDTYQQLKEAPLTELPRSRAFYDVGWVALHANLSSAKDDVSLFFKSSPLGSVSHSHGEQNSFTLTAWGTPLVISGGYYDWYGSPHHYEFTRQTRSKNTILVDGAGQHYRSINAAGEITEFFTGVGYDFTAGQAAQAYEGKLNDFLRETYYSVPDYFVIVDRLEAPKAVRYNWLLHTLAPPDVDGASQTVSLRQGAVGLQVSFLQPAQLQFEIADRPYAGGDALTVYKDNEVPPETEMPTQYHLAATTLEAAQHGFFVTVLHPYRQTVPQLQFSGSRQDNTFQILATGDERRDVTLISVDGQVAQLQGEGVSAYGKAAAVSRQEGQLAKLLLIEGEQLTLTDGAWVKVNAPATLAVDYSPEHVSLAAQLNQFTRLELTVPNAPTSVRVNDVEVTTFSWQDGRLGVELPSGEIQVEIKF